MLLKDFYAIINKANFIDDNFSVTIEFNSEHEIFCGHFPQNPVVPGVCLIQIIKEILELKLSKNLFLSKGDNIKFQTMINPEINRQINLSYNIIEQSDIIKIKCKLFYEESVFMSFSGSFTIVV